MEAVWRGVRAEKTFAEKREEIQGFLFIFLSAMKGEQSENGENSTNSVSAKDDGTAINVTSGMFGVWEKLTLALTNPCAVWSPKLY